VNPFRLFRLVVEVDGHLQHLGHIHRLDLVFHFHRLGAVAQHGEAVGAGAADQAGTDGKSLFRPGRVDPYALPFLHPHHAAAGTATHGVFPGPLHLHQLDAGDRLQDEPGRVVFVVVAAQVTGIVEGDPLLHFLGRTDPPLPDQLGQNLGMVVNLRLEAQVGIFVLETRCRRGDPG